MKAKNDSGENNFKVTNASSQENRQTSESSKVISLKDRQGYVSSRSSKAIQQAIKYSKSLDW